MKKNFFRVDIALIAVLIIAVQFLSGSIVYTARAESGVSVSVNPATRNVTAGDTFTLDVAVTADTAIAGVQFDLSCDPSLLEITSVTEGDLLQQGGNTTYFQPGAIDSTAGNLNNVTGAITTPGGEVSGQGIFAAVTFRAKAAGDSTLTLSNVIAGDKDGRAIPAQITGGVVTIDSIAGGGSNNNGNSNSNAGSVTAPDGASGEAAATAPSVPLIIKPEPYANLIVTSPIPRDLQGHWASATVGDLLAKGIVAGYPDGAFKPDNSVTRAEFASMLIKALGLTLSATAQGQFNDVPPDSWFYASVETAAQVGLVKGLGDGVFEPNANITREQMAALIVRALESTGYVTSGDTQALEEFNDVDDIGTWAQQSMAKAVNAGVVHGMTAAAIAPRQSATRAQAAGMTHTLLRLTGKL